MKATKGRVTPPPLINPHKLPPSLAYLLAWYNEELAMGRPLEWADLYHWSRMAVRPISGWEAEALRAIDRTFWRAQRDGGNQPPQD